MTYIIKFNNFIKILLKNIKLAININLLAHYAKGTL